MSHPLSDAIFESHLAVLRVHNLSIPEALLREMANNAAHVVMIAIATGDVTIEVDLGAVSDAVRDEEHQVWERQWAAPC